MDVNEKVGEYFQCKITPMPKGFGFKFNVDELDIGDIKFLAGTAGNGNDVTVRRSGSGLKVAVSPKEAVEVSNMGYPLTPSSGGILTF